MRLFEKRMRGLGPREIQWVTTETALTLHPLRLACIDGVMVANLKVNGPTTGRIPSHTFCAHTMPVKS